MMHLSGCSCRQPCKTVCALHPTARVEKRGKRDPTCTLKALSDFVSHVCSVSQSIPLYSELPDFLDFTWKAGHYLNTECREKIISIL